MSVNPERKAISSQAESNYCVIVHQSSAAQQARGCAAPQRISQCQHLLVQQRTQAAQESFLGPLLRYR